MRITTGTLTQSAPYDRAPTEIQQSYFGPAIAPHADTTRWTYTVPAARRAAIDLLEFFWRRNAVAAPTGLIQDYIQEGGGLVYLVLFRTTLNAVDNIQSEGRTGAYIMVAGAVLSFHTSDLGTGGSCDHMGNAHGIEFDV